MSVVRRTCCLTAVFVVGLAAGAASAQPPARQGAPSSAQAGGTLELVEIVGCLARGPNETWAITRAGQPSASSAPWTTLAAVGDALARPLGLLRFRLIGVSPFKPSAAEGRKVVVKGVLIPDAADPRVNVTSLQTAGEACPA